MDEENYFQHPSFAVIQLNRTSGHTTLFNSPFEHDSFVSLSIRPARVTRSLSNNDIFPARSEYIRVLMSHQQFAEMITSFNNGTGIPCTLARLGSDLIPSPDLVNHFNLFRKEGAEAIERCSEAFNEALQAVDNANITAKAKATIKSAIIKAQMAIGDRLPFIADQFVEHMESVVSSAKVEISTHADMVVHQAGIVALEERSEGIPVFGSPINVKALESE